MREQLIDTQQVEGLNPFRSTRFLWVLTIVNICGIIIFGINQLGETRNTTDRLELPKGSLQPVCLLIIFTRVYSILT